MTRVATSTSISEGGQPAEGDNVKADDAVKGSKGADELKEGSLNCGFQTQNSWSAAKEGKRKPSGGATEKKGPREFYLIKDNVLTYCLRDLGFRSRTVWLCMLPTAFVSFAVHCS